MKLCLKLSRAINSSCFPSSSLARQFPHVYYISAMLKAFSTSYAVKLMYDFYKSHAVYGKPDNHSHMKGLMRLTPYIEVTGFRASGQRL